MWKFLELWTNWFKGKCICGNDSIACYNGLPRCKEHYHEFDCSYWLGYDCDCKLEINSKNDNAYI